MGTGNPSARPNQRRQGAVYPRGHGESRWGQYVPRRPAGLSPWARGIRAQRDEVLVMKGSIPVGTGNPSLRCLCSSRRQVYPRGHGESFTGPPASGKSTGLSPWARGIPADVDLDGGGGGSIPVGTGNPTSGGKEPHHSEVYPRGHGESDIVLLEPQATEGLSPWARGILRRPGIQVHEQGSIPVGTGNPTASDADPATPRVYPRGHGESQQGRRNPRAVSGLSPWARGILTSGQALFLTLGSIPVGTGNPVSRSERLNAGKVYPRGHGESPRGGCIPGYVEGLSPWARGIRAA